MRIITGLYKGRRFEVPRTFKARPTTDFAKENIFNVLTAYVDFEGATALDLFSGTGSITLELVSRGCSQVVSVELDRDHHRFIKQCIGKLFPEHRINTDLHGQSEEIRVNPMPNPNRQSEEIRVNPMQSSNRQSEEIRVNPMQSSNRQSEEIRVNPMQSSNRQSEEIRVNPMQSSNRQSEEIRVNPMPKIQCIRGDVFRFIKSCHTQFDLIFADPPYALKQLPQIPALVLEKNMLKPGGVFVFEHGKDYDFSQHPGFVEHRSYGSVNFSIFRN